MPLFAIFVAGALGFWGVIHRQKADAREARKQRQAVEHRETQRHHDETRALAGALGAEIAVLSKMIGEQRVFFKRSHDAGKKLDPDIIESATPSIPPEIYLRNIERLTLLPSETVRDVVAFYVRREQIYQRLKQRSSLEDPSKAGPNPYETLATTCGNVEKHGNNTVAALDAFLAGKPPPGFQPETEAAPAPEPDTAPRDDKN